MRLGIVCHQVLDRMVSSRSLWDDRWTLELDTAWRESVQNEAGTLDVAERWPNYQLKRARLFRTAGSLHELLRTLPPDAVVIPEQAMVGLGGRLRGRPDLVVRAATTHRVIDYKTGPGVDRQTLAVRPAYARQLQLYALLEAEVSGRWPDSAHLFPLEGEPVAIPILEDECRRLATDTLRVLSLFNDAVPGGQPASISVETCSVCDYATSCAPFWSLYSEEWAPYFVAIRGVIHAVSVSPLGGVSVEVRSLRGSVEAETVLIRNIDPGTHPVALKAEVGAEISATGLREETSRGTFRLAPSSGLRIGSTAEPSDFP
jgi:hypothetical protein